MSDSGRNPDGTFAEGNTFSDGRNKYQRQQELRQLFADAVSHQDIQRLACKLTALALDGDIQAAKLLLLTLFKDQPAPAIAVQVNNAETRASRLTKAINIANRIRAGRQEQLTATDRVIEVPAKRGRDEKT